MSWLGRLIDETEDSLASVSGLASAERDQVVADFVDTIRSLAPSPRSSALEVVVLRLHRRVARLRRSRSHPAPAEVMLQASWSSRQIVVWAGGRGAPSESNEALADRLERAGGPPQGWELHPGVPLPGGGRAEAISISMKDALGWLVALNAEAA